MKCKQLKYFLMNIEKKLDNNHVKMCCRNKEEYNENSHHTCEIRIIRSRNKKCTFWKTSQNFNSWIFSLIIIKYQVFTESRHKDWKICNIDDFSTQIHARAGYNQDIIRIHRHKYSNWWRCCRSKTYIHKPPYYIENENENEKEAVQPTKNTQLPRKKKN